MPITGPGVGLNPQNSSAWFPVATGVQVTPEDVLASLVLLLMAAAAIWVSVQSVQHH